MGPTACFADLPAEILRHIGGMMLPAEAARGLARVNREAHRALQPDLRGARSAMLEEARTGSGLDIAWEDRIGRPWSYASDWLCAFFGTLASSRVFRLDFMIDSSAVTVILSNRVTGEWILDISAEFGSRPQQTVDYIHPERWDGALGTGEEAYANLLGTAYLSLLLLAELEVRSRLPLCRPVPPPTHPRPSQRKPPLPDAPPASLVRRALEGMCGDVLLKNAHRPLRAILGHA